MEYHLKYHHYVDMKTFNNFDFEQIILSTPSIQYETSLSKKPVNKNAKKAIKLSVDKETVKSIEENMNLLNDTEILRQIEEDSDWKDIYSNDKNEDPYDVVHCACGNHSSLGFMIQVT